MSREQLFAMLDGLAIAHETRDHRAIFTVEEGRDLKATMAGGHTKNLFLKDKAGRFVLAIADADTKVDLVALGKTIGAKGRYSFGKPEAMIDILGVVPGSVTPFALMNAQCATSVSEPPFHRIVLDRALFAHDPVWFHPLENTASTAISPADLMKFIEACGYQPLVLDLAEPNP